MTARMQGSQLQLVPFESSIKGRSRRGCEFIGRPAFSGRLCRRKHVLFRRLEKACVTFLHSLAALHVNRVVFIAVKALLRRVK